ncbi:hypothetical protein [Wolbachia endosymbiont (group A) of Myopa testacea]|uniref:hypothetical protein n=1 Tax=Wolbachia endosymbiont (group A) of Myopa testacea TaxID=3066148 RepID=UPI0033406A25
MKHASSLPEWQKNVVEFLSSRRKYRLFGWEFGPILLDELYKIRDYRTDYIRVGTFFTPIVAFSTGLVSFVSTRRVNLAAVVTSSLIVLGIITTLAVDYQMTKRKAGVVKERNYKTIQVVNSSMEVENGNRSRRSIDQPYLKPLLFQIRGWFVNIMSRLSFQSVSNKQTLLSAPLVNKEFVKGIDDKTKVVPDIRSISAQSDINGRILLADMLLAKRGKRQMYTSSADKQISLQEARGTRLFIKYRR